MKGEKPQTKQSLDKECISYKTEDLLVIDFFLKRNFIVIILKMIFTNFFQKIVEIILNYFLKIK